MPVLETDFLKALIDTSDNLHKASLKASAKLLGREWAIASSSFLELDLLLKNAGISPEERREIFDSLKAEIHVETILLMSHEVLSVAAFLQLRYPLKNFYFDSIHLATAALHDGTIVSSDKEFDKLSEVRRVALEKL